MPEFAVNEDENRRLLAAMVGRHSSLACPQCCALVRVCPSVKHRVLVKLGLGDCVVRLARHERGPMNRVGAFFRFIDWICALTLIKKTSEIDIALL